MKGQTSCFEEGGHKNKNVNMKDQKDHWLQSDDYGLSSIIQSIYKDLVRKFDHVKFNEENI